LNDFFFDFNRIVSQEVIEHIMVNLALQGLIIPSDIKRQHDAVILNVFLETIVRVASPELHFKILFIFPNCKRYLVSGGLIFKSF